MKYKILVVDDEAIFRQGLISLIERNSERVQAIGKENGAEAFERLSRGDIDAMFLDISMPKLNGLELLDRMRAEGMKKIPTVIISGFDSFEYARHAFRNEVTDYLLKPLTPSEAREVIDRIIVRLDQDAIREEHRDDARRKLESTLSKIEDLQVREELEKIGLKDSNQETAEESYGESGSVLVEQIRAYIETHYQEDLSISSIAKDVCYSPNYIAQVFHKETGTMLRDYIRDYRLERAKYLLRNSTYKVMEIGRRVGFLNNQYFCTVFRRHVGMTPQEYRESSRY